jgi:Cu(I)/Ag(I) efflux system membrane protein CusA/SilA
MKKETHMKFALILAAAALTVAAGAHAQDVPKPASAAAKADMPLADGEIRKLDAAAGLIVLRHGDIPNLGMPGMTMAFDVADKKMLRDLKVGDKVRFQAEMVKGKATVTEIRAQARER